MEKYIFDEGVGNLPLIIGDSYRYKNNKGEISLLHPCYATGGFYEIYCIEGELFEDVERFDTLKEAERRIGELLQEQIK